MSVGDTMEEVCSEPTAQDACTQTPRSKTRRGGGRASRMRRLLAFQAMLTVKKRSALVQASQQPEDRRQVFKGRFLEATGGIFVANLEVEEDYGDQGGE